MSSLEQLQRHGFPISDKTHSGYEIATMFGTRGVFVNPMTIYRIRSGTTAGSRIERRVNAIEAIENSVSKKDEFYHLVAQTGLDIRTFNRQGRFHSKSHRSKLADDLRVGVQDLGRSLRAMRVDMVLSEFSENSEELQDIFRPVAEKYLAAYENGWRSETDVTTLNEQWDRRSIRGFYENLYKLGNTMTWGPYEAEVLEEFYRRRRNVGSKPSLLDRRVIDAVTKKVSHTEQFAQVLRDFTGIPYDRVVHAAHVNVLLFGKPSPRYSFAA